MMGMLFSIKSFTAPGAPNPYFYQYGLLLNTSASLASIAVQMPNTQVAGSTNLIFVAAISGIALNSVTDTAGNTYKFVGYANAQGVPTPWLFQTWIYAAINIKAASANVVSANFASASINNVILCMEYRNCSTVNSIDGFCCEAFQITSGTGSPQSGTVSTTQNNDTLVSIFLSDISTLTLTIPTGFTAKISEGSGFDIAADTLAPAPGSFNPQWTCSSTGGYPIIWIVNAIALSSTPAAAPPLPAPPSGPDAPPMGWDSWRVYGNDTTQAQTQTQAAALVSTGLAGLGYKLVNPSGVIWKSRSAGALVPTANFPNVAGMCSYISGLGLKNAAYLAIGPHGSGCSTETSSGYEQTDANLLASLGYTYLMYDSCYDPQSSANAENIYATMGYFLQQSGANITYLVSCPNYADGTPFGSGSQSWVNQAGGSVVWVAPDQGVLQGSGQNLMNYATLLNLLAQVVSTALPSGPARFNMVDYLGVGNGLLSNAEGRSNFALWCILACPLWLGFEPTSASANTLATVMNTEMIAVDQDPLCIMGARYSHQLLGTGNYLDIWARPLSGGKWALVLMNQDTATQNILANFEVFTGNSYGYFVRDVINHTTMPAAQYISTNVASHDVAMYVLSPAFTPPVPVTVPSNGYYVTLNIYSAYHAMYLFAGTDYAWLIQSVISGPYPDTWTAQAALIALEEPAYH